MKNDGKFLENFVRKVEETFAGNAVKVESGKRIFDETGVQLAEFDLVITGKVGSTDLCVLIECRDRPSGGAAQASWIEQMSGRRQAHNFSHVIAVSTTGLSTGALAVAKKLNIELREVTRFDPQEFGSWIGAGINIVLREMKIGRIDASLTPRAGTSVAVSHAMEELLASKKGKGEILMTPRGGPRFSVKMIWNTYSCKMLGAFEEWKVPGPNAFTVNFESEGLNIRILTNKGLVFISSISFVAHNCEWEETELESSGVRYSKSESLITESVKFRRPSGEDDFSMEFQYTPS